MRKAPDPRKRLLTSCVLLAITIALSVGVGASAASDRGWERTELYVFPTYPGGLDCSEEFKAWIRQEVGSFPVLCTRIPLFGGGFTKYDTPLMSAGLGVHPYLSISSSGASTLSVAVAVPGMELEDVVELVLSADDERHTVTLDPGTRRVTIHGASSVTYIAFDIAVDQLPPTFLRTFAGAKKPVVYYGRSGKKKIKIDKRNAAWIGNMIDLHDAIGRALAQ